MRYMRSISMDAENLARMGVTMIINLLSDIELQELGVSLEEYQSACSQNDICLLHHPVAEMVPPDVTGFFEWNQQVV